MKKWLFLCGILMWSLCSIRTFAAEGSIRVALPKEMEGQEVFCKQDEKVVAKTTVDSIGFATFSGLSTGKYLIQIPDTEKFTFDEFTIQLPMWEEEEHKMIHDATVIPKYIEHVKNEIPPDTGDSLDGKEYIGLGMISLVIIAIMTCHNRFKCGRMSRKYSKRRRI